MNEVSNKYEDKGDTADTSSKRTCPLDRYDCRVGEVVLKNKLIVFYSFF
jgi:hypothetical protein